MSALINRDRNERAVLVEALETALEYADHSNGCSGPRGYRCRCLWSLYEPEIREILRAARTGDLS